jgi:hypothetical protein
MTRNKRSVEDLIAEMEGPAHAAGGLRRESLRVARPAFRLLRLPALEAGGCRPSLS